MVASIGLCTCGGDNATSGGTAVHAFDIAGESYNLRILIHVHDICIYSHVYGSEAGVGSL